MAWSAVANAVSSLLGNAITGSQNYYYDRKMQARAMAWQEKMSNTAIQRTVADSIKAGINPLHSLSGFSGASTGSVGGGSNGVPSTDVGSIFLNGMSTFANIKNQTNATNADVALKGAQTQDVIAGMEERVYRMRKMLSETNLNDSQRHLISKRMDEAEANIKHLKSLTEFNITNAKYIDNKNIRERNLTAGQQASSLNRYEQIKAHPTLSYMLDYLRGYNSQLK